MLPLYRPLRPPSTYDCVDETIEFARVRWNWDGSNQPRLRNFEVHDSDNDIVIKECGGTFFIYAQVRSADLT